MIDRITTIEMEEKLARYFNPRQNIIVPNVSWGFYIHECDLLVLRKSGHLLEIEIKISKADLKKDAEKSHKHIDYYDRVRELWFAIPDYLQDCIEYIPERAGVIIVNKNHDWGTYLNCKEIRQPKINTKAEKLCENEKLMLARLGTMRIWSLKRKIIEMKYKKTKKRISADKKQLRLEI